MQRFKNILYVAVPGSVSEAALERAISLATMNQAHLTVVDIIDKMPSNIKLPDGVPSPEEFQAKRVTKHQQALEERIVSRSKNYQNSNQSACGYIVSGNHPRYSSQWA